MMEEVNISLVAVEIVANFEPKIKGMVKYCFCHGNPFEIDQKMQDDYVQGRIGEDCKNPVLYSR